MDWLNINSFMCVIVNCIKKLSKSSLKVNNGQMQMQMKKS